VNTIRFFRIFLFLVLAWEESSFAQLTQGNVPVLPPLNASVSDFGTSFIFSPPPICSGCVETELGFLSLQDGRFLPAAITVAPFASHTDFSVLVNLLDSEVPYHGRTTNFGNRFDFVVRQQVFEKNGFTLTFAPRGTVFTRCAEGGRAGVTLAAQYTKGSNLFVTNFTLTRAVNNFPANPRLDYQGSFDYYRTLSRTGVAVFVGFQHEVAAGQRTAGTEQGLALPFRNGQMELAVEQLNLDVGPMLQFQARVIVNWGEVFRRK